MSAWIGEIPEFKHVLTSIPVYTYTHTHAKLLICKSNEFQNPADLFQTMLSPWFCHHCEILKGSHKKKKRKKKQHFDCKAPEQQIYWNAFVMKHMGPDELWVDPDNPQHLLCKCDRRRNIREQENSSVFLSSLFLLISCCCLCRVPCVFFCRRVCQHSDRKAKYKRRIWSWF